MEADLPGGDLGLVFTDIEGSTRLLHELGDDRYGEVIARHHDLVREAIAAHDAVEVRVQGDSFFVVVPPPADAIALCVDIQRRIEREAWDLDRPVRVRIGVHRGVANLYRGEYIGMSVHEAARVSSVAHGGQILVTEAARAAYPESDCIDLGRHRLKDLAAPVQLWQVVAPGLDSSFPAPRTLGAPSNLPAHLTSFVGRDDEVGAVAAALAGSRLLTLTGTGGAGKTRLATEVAALVGSDFPDGTWLIEFDSVTHSGGVAREALRALAIRDDPARPDTDVLTEFLAAKRALLVLDGCEHVVEGAAVLARALLRAAPDLRVMATSREPLRVVGESVRPVEPLGLPAAGADSLETVAASPAVRLFLDRARSSDPHFVLDESTAPGVARICSGLDGLPLAIELAAAKVRHLHVDQIAAGLEDRFALLDEGFRGEADRHRTLEAAIEWSYQLLDDTQQRTFRRLGAFSGRFGPDAVAAVSPESGPQTAAVLGALVDRSLVDTVAVPELGEPRYRLLETLRSFAQQRLSESDDDEVTHDRHVAWAVAAAEAATPGNLHGADAAAVIRRLDLDHDNLRAALAWALKHDRDEPAIQLAVALADYWGQRGFHAEGRSWLEQAAGRHSVSDLARAQGLAALGRLAINQGDYDDAIAALDRSLELASAAGSDRGVASALNSLGTISGLRSDHAGARVHFERVLEVATDLGDDALAASALSNIASTQFVAGDIDTATATLARSRDLARAAGDVMAEARADTNLGFVAMQTGDLVTARRRIERAVSAFRKIGNRRDLPRLVNMLGSLALQIDQDRDHATVMFEESLGLAEEIGDARMTATALGHLSGLAADDGRTDEAYALAARALPLFVRVGDPLALADATARLAGLAEQRGLPELAHRLGTATDDLRKRDQVGDPDDARDATWTPEDLIAAVESALA